MVKVIKLPNLNFQDNVSKIKFTTFSVHHWKVKVIFYFDHFHFNNFNIFVNNFTMVGIIVTYLPRKNLLLFITCYWQCFFACNIGQNI